MKKTSENHIMYKMNNSEEEISEERRKKKEDNQTKHKNKERRLKYDTLT